MHWDHCQNTDMFTNARILVHPKEIDYAHNPNPADHNAAKYIAEMMDKMRVEPISDGDVVAEDGKMTVPLKPYSYPAWAMDSVHVGGSITPDSFRLNAPGTGEGTPLADGSRVKVQVIEVGSGKVAAIAGTALLTVAEGQVHSDVEQDVLMTSVFERNHET